MLQPAVQCQRPSRGVQRSTTREKRNCIAWAAAPQVAVEPATGAAEEPLSFEPEELYVEPGVLSPMSTEPSDVETDSQGSPGFDGATWRFDESGYLRAVLTARVYDVAKESLLEVAPLLSKRLENTIWLKREDMQPVFSFKLRGAFNKMANLPKEKLEQGVICSSAGNHAQGVALAAKRLGTSAVICMPENTPEIKVDAVRALGGEVRLVGESYTETQSYALNAAEEEQRSFIAPYDDPLTIAGQGTVGAEILKQLGSSVQDLHAIFVPIGGGGLIAGIAAYVKALRPEVSIIGVEPSGANCMALSLREGRRVTLSKVDAFADGVAVKSVGQETFRLCQKHVDGVVLVDNASISAAIKDMFTETRTILEPAGALALAGAKAYLNKHEVKGKNVVAITSGANMNFDRLRLVADLANFGLQTEAMLVVSIPESPGEFLTFINIVLDSEDGSKITVSEFKYRYSVDRPAKILFSLSTASPAAIESAVQRVKDAGYQCRNVTDSSAAQLHLRHMVGGRPRSYTGCIDHEKMVVVNFPEKAGALKHFLSAMCPAFNVTMFHYRSTGNRSSSVLLGLQVPPERDADYTELVGRLSPLDYTFEELDDTTQDLFDEFIS